MKVIPSPKILPYGFKSTNVEEYLEAYEWCLETFKQKKNWEHRNNFWGRNPKHPTGYGAFYFDDKIDATAFKLRWL